MQQIDGNTTNKQQQNGLKIHVYIQIDKNNIPQQKQMANTISSQEMPK